MVKKIISILLTLALLLPLLAACGDAPDPEQLATPANLTISESGLITWDAVEHATSYAVTVGENTYTVTEPSYQVTNLSVDFHYSVVARADGYADSAPTATATYTAVRTPPVPDREISVAVGGRSEVQSGHSITLTATVTGTEDTTVIWEIVRGGEYATIDPISGVLTAHSGVEGDQIVEVLARCLADETVTGSRVLTVVSRPALTQAMLDEIAGEDVIAFDGFMTVYLYNYGMYDNLEQSSSTNIYTAMDGVHWYAEYLDGNTGLPSRLYYENNGGVAGQVGVNLLNEEEYFPMLDDAGETVSWIDSGLYNGFSGLRVSDFTFDEQNWRYVYTGTDRTLMQRLISAANPYDFTVKSLSLILADGAVMGLFAESEDDYSLAPGYRSVLELTVAVNFGDTVEVPTISKYNHSDMHDPLTAAIANMQALDSYSTRFTEMTANIYSGGIPTVSGYDETVTAAGSYFDPYTVSYSGGEQVRHYTGAPYGYCQINPDLYNAYYYDGDSDAFVPSRAYYGNVSAAAPSFAFAAEIFTSYYENEDTGEITYYVDEPMCQVASAFYFGMGNDVALYGLFAAESQSSTSRYTPYVTVRDGYIVEAGFYFNIVYIYGVVEIEYGDFNTAALPEDLELSFMPRQVPTSWEELSIICSSDSSTTGDDEEVNAAAYLDEMFGDADLVPFFGAVLGDTYGFGLTTYHLPTGSTVNRQAVEFYYDVPLGSDYTIDAPLDAVRNYLISLGFQKNAYDEYTKGSVTVAPVDSSLDLIIYVWKTPSA